MISLQNTARAAALTGNINQVYSGPSLASSISELTDQFTMEAGDAVNGTADFVPFTSDGYLLLENSRLRIGGLITNALNVSVKLQRVSAGMVFNATTTSASTAVVCSPAGLLVGQSVAGTGIPAGATIAAVTATGFTLSAAATATGSTVITATGAADITAAVAAVASAATAATAAQALPFAPINGGPPVPFFKGDKLRLYLTAVTSIGTGRALIPSIPFVSRMAPGQNP